MEPRLFPDIPPRRKPAARLLNQAVLFVLGRSLQSLSRREPLIQDEVRGWPADFTLLLTVEPDQGALALQARPEGRLRYLGRRWPEAEADVIIRIKHWRWALRMFTGQMGVDRAYAAHAVSAQGDLTQTVSVGRVLNVAQAVLFPAFLARRLMKRLPPLPPGRLWRDRLTAYLLGIPFGW